MARRNLGVKLLDDRWVLTDQLIQLKGVVEFNERSLRWLEVKDEVIRKKYDTKIKQVATNVKKLRLLIKKLAFGHTTVLDNILKQDKEVYLICRKKPPEEIIENLKHMIFRQRKAVDKIKAEIGNTKKDLFEVEMNIAVLKEKVESGDEIVRDSTRMEYEKYAAAIEYTNTQTDVCSIMLECYKKITGVLKKDSLYFDDVITDLKNDVRIQSETILKILELGQLACDDFTWLREEAKRSAVGFNIEADRHRKAIRKMGKYCQALEMMKTKLNQYAAKSYPMFQEVVKEPEQDPEEIKQEEENKQLDKLFEELEMILGIDSVTHVFSEMDRLKTTAFELDKLIAELKQNEIEKKDEFQHLKALSRHMEFLFPEEVKTFIKAEEVVMNEIDDRAKIIQKIRKQRKELKEEINEDTLHFKNLNRMLWPVELGDPDHLKETFDDKGQVIEDKMDYYDREDPFNLFEKDIQVRSSPIGPVDVVHAEEDDGCESDTEGIPFKLFDTVCMKAQVLHDSIGDKGTEDECDQETLILFGDALMYEQARREEILSAMFDKEQIHIKPYKPKFEDSHDNPAGCERKARLELKFMSRQLIVENEIARERGEIKFHLHPQGVYRGMYVEKGSSDEEEEEEKNKLRAQGERDEGVDDTLVEEEESDIGFIETEEEPLDSDLDPWQPKPHICY